MKIPVVHTPKTTYISVAGSQRAPADAPYQVRRHLSDGRFYVESRHATLRGAYEGAALVMVREVAS